MGRGVPIFGVGVEGVLEQPETAASSTKVCLNVSLTVGLK